MFSGGKTDCCPHGAWRGTIGAPAAAHTAADAQPEADAQAQTVPSDTNDSDATQKLLDDAVTQVFGAGAQEPRGDAEQTDGDSEQPKE